MKNEKHADRPHALSAEETLLQLGVTRSGLNARDAARRRRKAGANRLWQVTGVPLSRLAAGEIFDLAGVLLLLAVAASAAFDHGSEAGVIAGILAFSALLRVAAAVAAQRVFLDAARKGIPCAAVLRGGKVCRLPAESVVAGDILLLTAGDTAVCDARLIDGEVEVLEAPLTGGEGVSRKRAGDILAPGTPCGERSNILFASTTVISGSCTAVAVATGERTYAYARRGYIPVAVSGELNAVSKLSPWCRNVSLIMTAAVLIVTLGGFWLGGETQPLDELFLSTLSLAVASMSEFLGVIASVVLALTVRRLSGAADVIKSPASIEKAAHCRTVVFTTENLLPDGDFRLGEWFDGEEMHPAPSGSVPAALRSLLRQTEICSAAALPVLLKCGAASGGAFAAVPVRELYEKYGVQAEVCEPPLDFAPGARLQTYLRVENGVPQAYVCGELADVLACCTESGEAALSPERRRTFAEAAEEYRSRGIHTVAVARRVSPYDHLRNPGVIQSKMTLLGFYTFENPIPQSIGRFASGCREAGIRLILLAGEWASARRMAEEAEIFAESDILIREDRELLEQYLHGDSGKNAIVYFSDRAKRTDALRTICAGANATLLTASSLSDLTAFPQADVTAAAVTSGNVLPQCVQRKSDILIGGEGRRVSGACETLRVLGACKNALHTLRRAAQYLIFSQTMRLSVVCAAALLRMPVPKPPQILFLGLLLDLAAVLAMAFRAPDSRAIALPEKMLEFPSLRDGMLFYIASGILDGILLMAIPFLSAAAGLIISEAETSAFLFVGCVVSGAVCWLLLYGKRKKGETARSGALSAYAVFAAASAAAEILRCGVSCARLWIFLPALLPAAALFVLSISYRIAVNSAQK